MKLSELPVGGTATLSAFGSAPLHLHLLSMGINPGMQVTLVRRFPMKGNLYIQIGNRHLVMRFAEASQLEICQAN